ncbi:OmpA family protein [Pseudomonas sp. ZM23]|uniref:OmpA family protein n=1 Tax=Pseudomonas triclosanedens TaxID=2961893 RepID=A0ABY7A296_9PSED|nr:OmpA family protein [Pseudomonas triclosanedens]MCP8464376.1 OmpA family protein [Pseudomonas triclosanedens]MCP8471510.1 OmpA family protein [Pseudomonas triclosanedens]MCP8477681.1 OmpA family protein [Pseudomonas triclosanedens]WAI51136.1 OmpA family protein [Pseudomonas triclosanedens]
MRLLKTSTLVLCIGLSACSQFQAKDQENTAAAPGAASSHWWWPFGAGNEVTAAAPAPEKKPVEAPKVAEAGSKQPGGHWWWPFGVSEGKAEADKATRPQNVQVSKEWLDQHEKTLRAAVAGSKFTVERRENALVLIAPVDGSFNPKRPELLLPVTLGPLGNVAKMLQNDPESGVLVLGHSDSSGDKTINDKVSLQRAQAVSSIFRLSGLGADRLRLKGVGSSLPRADNGSAEGRALNRRVEVLLTQRTSLLALAQNN